MGPCDQQESSALSPMELRCSAEELQRRRSQAAMSTTTGSSIIVKGEGTTCTRAVMKRVSSKRKSRAVAKPAIPVVSADKSTFRDLVLQLTGNPPSSSSPPPPPPPPAPLLSYMSTHTTTPSFLSPNPPYPHLDALLHLFNSPLSFSSPLPHSPPFSTSHSTHAAHPPSPPSNLSFHSSALPFPPTSSQEYSPDLMPIHPNKFSKTLELLQALKQSLLHIKCLREYASSHSGLLGQSKYEMTSNGNCNDGIDGGDLKPLLRSKYEMTSNGNYNDGIDGGDLKPLLRSTDTCVAEHVAHMKSLDMEHLQNLRQAIELESFLLTRDDTLDELFTINLIHNVKSWLSCDTINTQNLSLELADTHV